MIKKVKYIALLVFIFSMGLTVKSFARITTNDPTANSGGTVTITISSQEPVASGAIDVSSNGGLTFQSVTGGTANGTKVAFAKSENATSGLATYTFKVPTVSSDTTYKIVFASTDMANADGVEVASSSATATITVKAPETQQETPQETPAEQTPTTPVNTDTTETRKQENPDFTETNKTMYSTKGINLRESWSTSSKATYIEKDTELTVTATSTKTVNGYVWYRVSYNGQTKYVASFLLTSTKPEEKKDEEKSNNANLKTLKVEGKDLTPAFSPSVTSYTVQVSKETKKIEIKAEPEDAKATVSIKGNEALKEEGESLATVSVSAEDGTTKIYEIKVEKIAEENKALGLKSLNIEGTNISSKFKPDTYNYEIDIKPNVTNLKIEAVSNEETATVEILGNENFQDGENLITIIVSSQDGENKVTYQIKANRKDEEANKTEKQQANSKIYLYIGIGAVVLIALIIVVVYTIKHRNSNELDEEEYDYFPDELPEKKIEKDDDNGTRKKGKHF